MKTSVIKKHILEGLAPYVKDYGFKIVKSQFEIVRKDKEKSFRWVFINEKPLWEDEKHYSLDLWCNFKKILDVSENIKPKYGVRLINFCAQMNLLAFKAYVDGKVELSDKLHFINPTPSSLILLDGVVFDSAENFKQYRNLPSDTPVFIIDDGDSYKPVVDYLRTLLPYVAMYFDQIDTIEKLDKLYNRLPIQYNPNARWPDDHACVGLIAAKLVNNPNYDILKSAYLQYLKDINYNEKGIENVKYLIDYLDNPEFK